MPVSLRTTKTDTEAPDHLRPYIFHGLDLSVHGGQATGDCLFCGASKFTVHIDTGLWRCWVCGGGQESGGGNPLTFIRALHAFAYASNPPGFANEVMTDRRLYSASTALAWGIARSPIPPHNWLLPGYGTGGALDQLYKRTRVMDSNGEWKWLIMPTPGIWTEGKAHALHLPSGDFDPARPAIYLCEGPWDGAAMWETAVTYPGWPVSNIIAVPGCNVWRDEWTTMCKGKHVVFMYDSDHPRQQGAHTAIAGYDGTRRVARKLAGHAASVRFLRWGPDGYDPARPDGWDVRDHLSGRAPKRPLGIEDRREALNELVSLVSDAPDEWSVPTVSSNGNGHTRVNEAKSCNTWDTCLQAWDESRGGAMRWRSDLNDSMLSILAVAASTQQAGNQLFLDLVGAPGSAKTTLCRGLLTSEHCVHLENMTKLISGYKMADDPDKDCSFLARANGKTWITCEFDTVLTSPEYTQLMGKIRRIFDGEMTATYGNSDVDRVYTSLRTPWIRAGTFKMMDQDQSQLGDRFLRVIINEPGYVEKREIMRSALRSERTAMLSQASGTAGSLLDPKTRQAHALTGGYVNWLWEHVETRLAMVDVPVDAEEKCMDLAEMSVDLRARPNEDKRKKESNDCKDIPTRLTRQNIRLAQHLAVVMNKQSVDNEVMRIVRKVALDTAFGHSLNIVRWLMAPNPKTDGCSYQESGGLSSITLEGWMGMEKQRAMNYLLFLRKMEVLKLVMAPQTAGMWTMTDRVYDLYLRVIGW